MQRQKTNRSSTCLLTFSFLSMVSSQLFADVIYPPNSTITTPIGQNSNTSNTIINHDTTISTGAATAIVIASGTLSFIGDNILVNTNATTNNSGHGIYISTTNGASAHFISTGNNTIETLTTTRSQSNGIVAGGFTNADGLAQLQIANMKVITNGPNGKAILFAGNGTGIIDHSTLVTRGGNGAYGMMLNTQNTAVTISNSLIQASDMGIASYGNVIANNINIQTTAADAIGIYTISDTVILNNKYASTNIQNSQINTQGNGAYGIVTDGQFNPVFFSGNSTAVNTAGQDAYGIYSSKTANFSANNFAISTLGQTAFGVYVSDSEMTFTNSTISTQGLAAVGLFADSTSIVNQIHWTGGSINSVNGPAVGIASGSAIFDFTNTYIKGANNWLVVGPSVISSPPNTLTPPEQVTPQPFDSESLDYSQPTPPLPASIDASSSNNLSHPTSNLAYQDIVNIAFAPVTVDINVINSTLEGGALTDLGSISSVILSNNSLWNMTGNSNLTSLTNNLSTINFVFDGDTFKTLTVNDYVGVNGTIGLNTFLGGSNSPSDLLIINGGSATGRTELSIQNIGGQGALTLGNGILVVEAENGGITDPGAFYLSRPIIAGPFEYSLFRSSFDGSGPENWYLRSLCPPGRPECSPEPPVPPVPPTPRPPNYRSEVGLYPVLPAMTLLYGQALIDTLHQRVGQGKWPSDSVTAETSAPRVWGRVLGMHGDRDRITSRKIFRSSTYDYNFAALQIGGDLYERTTTNGTRNHIGTYGAFGRGTGDVKRPSFYLGSNEFTAYTIGSYWTICSPTEAYIDAVVQGTWYNNASSQSYRLPALETSGWGIGLSVEGGYPFIFKQQWMIEPQAQLAYQSTNLDNGKDIGATIRFRNNDSLAGRLGIRFANKHLFNSDETKTLTTWFRPNFWYQFRGNPQAQFSSAYGVLWKNP